MTVFDDNGGEIKTTMVVTNTIKVKIKIQR